MATIVSSWFVTRKVIISKVDKRIQFEELILSGKSEPPYNYRLLKPILHKSIEKITSPFITSNRARHIVASVFLLTTILFFIHLFFYFYLRLFFSESWTLIGVLILNMLFPLSVTGFYMIGDFITLLLYLLGINLIFRNKDIYILLVVGIGMINRSQIVFLTVFQLSYIIANRGNRKRYYYFICSILTCIIVFVSIRLLVGSQTSKYNISYHVAQNMDLYNIVFRTVPIWFADIGVLLILSLASYKRSNQYFRIALWSIVPYTVLFFLNGNMWELAKYLPVSLILIPMSLQVLSDQYVKIDLPPAKFKNS